MTEAYLKIQPFKTIFFGKLKRYKVPTEGNFKMGALEFTFSVELF